MSQDLTGITGTGVEAISHLVPWTFYNSPKRGLGAFPHSLPLCFFSPSTLPPFLSILTRISSIEGLFLGKA